MTRFNKLNRVIRSSLEMLKKAVKGLVVMSSSMETTYASILYQKVPPEWEAAAYPSRKPLGSWVDDLFARLATLHVWLVNGPPTSFWVSGFFFPQGFMTGALQMHARKTLLPIDTLDFRTQVMPFDEGAVPGAPTTGVYIHGLFLEGARWDVQAGRMAESLPGVLFHKMPCVWLEPVKAKDIVPGPVYRSPFFKTAERRGVLSTTGHSTNFVTVITLASEKPQDHWVRRGVALISQLDD
jgi:dynein heavy chain